MEETLTNEEKKLLGFALFTTAMKIGPESFDRVEKIAVKTGVLEEFVFYAKDWIEYSQKHKTVN